MCPSPPRGQAQRIPPPPKRRPAPSPQRRRRPPQATEPPSSWLSAWARAAMGAAGQARPWGRSAVGGGALYRRAGAGQRGHRGLARRGLREGARLGDELRALASALLAGALEQHVAGPQVRVHLCARLSWIDCAARGRGPVQPWQRGRRVPGGQGGSKRGLLLAQAPFAFDGRALLMAVRSVRGPGFPLFPAAQAARALVPLFWRGAGRRILPRFCLSGATRGLYRRSPDRRHPVSGGHLRRRRGRRARPCAFC
jgi:hypothetical protein